jgi:hypothetical protein
MLSSATVSWPLRRSAGQATLDQLGQQSETAQTTTSVHLLVFTGIQ